MFNPLLILFFKIFPTLLDIASNSGTNGEERLMSLHCLRDAVDVHPELMVDSADEIIAKVCSYSFVYSLFIKFHLACWR